MPRLGIDLGSIGATAPGAAWINPDPGRQTFEIQGVIMGVNSQGEHAGEPYVMVKCMQVSGDDPGTKTFSQYLGLSTKEGRFGVPLSKTKGYLEAWGRTDIIAQGADAELDDLIGTVFEADVTFRTDRKTGEERPNLQAFTPVSHADNLASSSPAQQEIATDPRPATAPVAGMRRGR